MLEPLAWRDAAAYRVYFGRAGAGTVAAARADATDTAVAVAADSDVATENTGQRARASWTLDRLLSPLDMDELLEIYGRTVQAQHRAVAGSMLVKMIGRSLPALWKLCSVHNVRVRFALPEATLILAETDTTVSLHVPADACMPLPQLPGERAAARDEWLRSMIDGCLRPLLEAVSFRSGLSKAILWENLFIYLHHAYGEWMREAATDGDDGGDEHTAVDGGGGAAMNGMGNGGGNAKYVRIAGDYAALTREGSPFHLPSASFANPLHPGRELRIRRTCCLQHALPSGNTCYSCPHLCDAKRKEIYVSKK